MVESQLIRYLTGRFPERDNIQIHSFREIGEGWETQISGFNLEYGIQGRRIRQNLVIRRYPGIRGSTNAEREFHIIRTLNDLEYPTPKVHLVETDATQLGMPFVLMDLIDGGTMNHLLKSRPPEKQHELYNQMADLFVRLHRLDWKPFAGKKNGEREKLRRALRDPYFYVQHTLSEYEDLIKRFKHEELLPILEWLQARSHNVPCIQLSFTHGDFHPLNIMFDVKGTPFVIDWTAAKIADARADLAWTMVLSGTFTGPKLRDRILLTYEEKSGSKIEEIEFFEVLAVLRRLFDFLVAMEREPSSQFLREDITTIMRQYKHHYQNVYALLQERTGIAIPKVEQLIRGLS